jgi:hypothetical protein
MTTTDAVAAFDVARNIVERGTVATTGNLLGLESLRGTDGRYYSPFGLAQSIYDIPFYLAGAAVARTAGLTIGKPDTIPKATVAMSQTVLGALIVWQVFGLARRVIGSGRAAMRAALTCAFGSVLWPYAQFGFGQPLACATLLAAVTSAWAGVADGQARRFTWAGLWLAAGLLSRHEVGAAALPIAAWIAWTAPDSGTRKVWLARFAPGVVGGTAVWLAYNAIRFGNPIDTGHLRDPVPGFGSSIADGLAGLLFSPAASVFLYSPFVVFGALGLAALVRQDRRTGALLGAIVILFLMVYASLGNWVGGRSYGSRYLVIVLPYLGVGWGWLLTRLGPRASRLAFAAMLAIGIAVQLPGVLVDYAKVRQDAAASGVSFSTERAQWAWSAAPLVLNARALPQAVFDNIAYVAGSRTPPPVTARAGPDDRSFSQQFAFSLDLWWLYLFYMGALPRSAVVLTGFVLLAWTAWCAAGLSRATRELS